ncbi:hypothetical protein [Cribrihabitans neustonicus]|uniref:hypothetical protein n=1 Tax=Cribrihabitans neustonicus TaxID=1429085 RepID=UPI003B5A8F7F
MLSFDYNGHRYEQWTEQDALQAGVPADVIAGAKLKGRRSTVSAECRRRIYAAASVETQMNIATAASVISGKPETDRSEDENGILAGVGLALEWVTAMRANVDALTADPAADYQSDAVWPELPAEVLAVIDRY